MRELDETDAMHVQFIYCGDCACFFQCSFGRGGDARGKNLIKPLKETNLGVAQALFAP